MTGRLERPLALVMALVALLVAGCAMADRAPAASPKSRGSVAIGDSRHAEEQGDRDSDGIPDRADQPASPSTLAFQGNQLAAPVGGAMPARGAPPPPPPPPPPQAPGEKKPAEPARESAKAEGSEPTHETSMLIYTARVTMAVYQVDQGLAAVEKIARDMGGYLAQKRDREIRIRVPRARFEPTLAAIDKIGDVLHRDIEAQDVTDEFVDTEIRIKNARAMQVRLKALLEKANVKEALELEKEMRRVTEELELLEGKLKLLKDKIAYSTITVAFEARNSAIPATRIKLPFPWLQQLGLPTLLQLSEDR
jgi:hypothetical protein